jgi:tRNA-dihydrouridine synthase
LWCLEKRKIEMEEHQKSNATTRKRRLHNSNCSGRFVLPIMMIAVGSTSRRSCGSTAFSFSENQNIFTSLNPLTRKSHQYLLHRVLAMGSDNDCQDSSSSPSTSPALYLPSHPDTPIRSVMAPMVAASDYPFRLFLREYCGIDLTYTQMLHSKNYVHDAQFRKTHLDLWETGVIYPKLVSSQITCLGDLDLPNLTEQAPSAPLMVQLAGHDVDLVVQAALMLYEHTDGNLSGIDLNCGCPQQIAKKGNYGAFLMERDSQRVCEILKALRKNLPSKVAVSAKIRLPFDDDTLRDRIPRLVETGINFMTVHGRTVEENKTKVGAVHVDRIRLAIEEAHKIDPNFPVVANGGMENYNDIQNVRKSTGAVAAMSSEALLETPNLFQKSSLDITTPQDLFQQQIGFAKNYLSICERVGPPLPGVVGKTGSFNTIRGHLFKFLHRYLNSDNPDLRDKLAAHGNESMKTLGEAIAFLEKLEGRYDGLSEDDWMSLESSAPEASWYRRHRKPDRYVHQKETRVAPVTGEISVEDRKQEIKARIARLKAEKQHTKKIPSLL